MKNTSYFSLKALFVFKIFEFFIFTFWSRRKNGLIRKRKLISKFRRRHNLVNEQVQYTYCPLSHEIKATRQLEIWSVNRI